MSLQVSHGKARQGSLIIVTGLPAAGKSCVAAALVAHLGWPLLAKDAVKEPLLERFPDADAATSRALSDASFALLFALAPVLLDAAPGGGAGGELSPRRTRAPLRRLMARPRRSCSSCAASPSRCALNGWRRGPGDPDAPSGHRDAAGLAPGQSQGAMLSSTCQASVCG